MLKVKDAFSSFSVTDIETAREFYQNTLGLKVKDGVMGLLEIHVGKGQPVIIYPKTDHVPASFTVLNLQVDDVDKSVDALNASNITMEHYEGFEMDERGISRRRGPAIAWFKDPFGNILSLIQST